MPWPILPRECSCSIVSEMVSLYAFMLRRVRTTLFIASGLRSEKNQGSSSLRLRILGYMSRLLR